MLGCFHPPALDPAVVPSNENSRHLRSRAHAWALLKHLNRVADFHESWIECYATEGRRGPRFLISYNATTLDVSVRVQFCSKKSTFNVIRFPVNAMKAYGGSGAIAPLILNLSTGRRWIVNITRRWAWDWVWATAKDCDKSRLIKKSFLGFCMFSGRNLTLVWDSGVPRNFVWGGGSTNSVEDREKGDLGAVAP